MAEITVLVPVYNVERYLEKCLDSILNQTFSDLEVICMDDGSTDASGTILDRYAAKDKRLRIVHKENTGYGNTMNQAMDLAEGKYIGIVESDDYIATDMYERLYQTAEQFELDFVKTDFYKIWNPSGGTERLKYCHLTEQAEMYGRVLEPNLEKASYFLEKFTWNALYRREFLKNYRIRYNETPGASFQDNGFWFQTFYFAKRVMFLKEAYYYYKQDNPDSSVNSDCKMYAMKQEYDFIRNFLLRQNETDREFYRICFHFRLDGYLFTLYMLAKEYKSEFARIIREECDFYERNGEADFSRFSQAKREAIQQIRKGAKQ